MKKIALILFISLVSLLQSIGQDFGSIGQKSIDYANPKEYEIGGITVSGVQYLDPTVLILLTELQVGETITIPGEQITKAIEKLWDQGLFSEVKISMTKTIGDKAFLDIYLKERPRLSKFSFTGVKRSEADDLREQINLVKGSQVTENILMNTEQSILNYFEDKGFLNTEVDITQVIDTTMTNSVLLNIDIKKNERIKINKIHFVGNEELPDKKLRRAMKETKQKTWYNVFKASKFIESDYKEDKKNIIAKYNELGYRDAKIIYDSITRFDDKTIDLYIGLKEGKKYYIRNISWLGNTKYNSKLLSQVLGIKKGDIYNQTLLEEKLLYDPQSVFSLYQDNGYLFSNITPVEVLVENDSIDIEMRIYEGKQARINNVTVTGNTRTNDHVIMREVRTPPGALYKRSEVQRTIREFAQMGYFDPEKLNVDFQPNPADGTVDLEYIVEEQPSDQIELSGGWGAGMIVGTLGLSFNNFSLRNIFNPKAYRPLPAGDGQHFSIRAQASGLFYQSYSLTFVEPWLGGRKPNSLTTSIYHSVQQNYNVEVDQERASFKVSGAAIGLGRRLEWPDDFFTLYHELSYKHYRIYQWGGFLYDDGYSNNISLKTNLSRHSSGPNPIFPTTGSSFNLSLEVTPPYSWFSDIDYTNATSQIKYKWIEYHKWKFTGSWFMTLIGSRTGDS
ncbi:MAG TPA: outer membrane protein assembly factor BamA, partial [Bacteroidales bacterium]|nr:outer membrane protein assembly factor BamA [Bacteroidales bacterium]